MRSPLHLLCHLPSPAFRSPSTSRAQSLHTSPKHIFPSPATYSLVPEWSPLWTIGHTHRGNPTPQHTDTHHSKCPALQPMLAWLFPILDLNPWKFVFPDIQLCHLCFLPESPFLLTWMKSSFLLFLFSPLGIFLCFPHKWRHSPSCPVLVFYLHPGWYL